MKHIYLFNNVSRAASYGVGTYIRQMAECLKGNLLFKVTIVELNSEEKEFKIVTDKRRNIRKIYIPAIEPFASVKNQDRYMKNTIHLLVPYISSSEKNIFHFNYQRHYTLFNMMKKKWPDCYILLTVHYLNWCFTLKGSLARFRKVLTKPKSERNNSEEYVCGEYEADKNAFQLADRIICLSEYTRNVLHSEYSISKEKVSVIYNGLKEQKISWNSTSRTRKREKMLFGKDERIVLFVGRLDEIKGVEYLIRAFRLLLQRIPDSRLVIVGEGDYNPYFKECTGIWNKVTFTGKLTSKELEAFYQIADVGVMPSFHEQCSYVAIEMMMHGLPLIGTSTTGLKEMLGSNEKYMLEVEEKDEEVFLSVERLNQALYSILKDDFPREAGKNSRAEFDSKYTLCSMQQKMMELYQSI